MKTVFISNKRDEARRTTQEEFVVSRLITTVTECFQVHTGVGPIQMRSR